jgi:hypothetical protein
MSSVTPFRVPEDDEFTRLVDGGRAAVTALRPLFENMYTISYGESHPTPTPAEQWLVGPHWQAEQHANRLDEALRELRQAWG